MKMRRLGGIALATSALLLTGTAAHAEPPPPACGFSCSSLVVDGDWLWLPSIGVPAYQWAYVTPGSPFWKLLWFPA